MFREMTRKDTKSPYAQMKCVISGSNVPSYFGTEIGDMKRRGMSQKLLHYEGVS